MSVRRSNRSWKWPGDSDFIFAVFWNSGVHFYLQNDADFPFVAKGPLKIVSAETTHVRKQRMKQHPLTNSGRRPQVGEGGWPHLTAITGPRETKLF